MGNLLYWAVVFLAIALVAAASYALKAVCVRVGVR